MATRSRRVLITGVGRFLGLRIARALGGDERVERVIGVDLEEPPEPIGGMEFVRADIRSPLIARVLESFTVDTIVHTNILSSPGRLGGRSGMKENNVIGTLQLLAAAQRSEHVRRVVVKSSAAVYGAGPGDPSLITEDYSGPGAHLGGYARDCIDAEAYARDFGRRRPDVGLVVLRTQNVVGPTVHTSMTAYLSLPVIPSVLGFDPRLQFLHEDDAVTGFLAAAFGEATGIFNLAAPGIVYLSKAARLLGRPQLPLVSPAAHLTGFALQRLGVVDFPPDQLRLLIYGRVLDISRARSELGFSPRFTTEQALIDFRDHRRPDAPPGSPERPWERELVEYLRDRSGQEVRG